MFAVERGKPGQVNDVLMKASIVASMHMQGRSSDEIEDNLNTIDSCQGATLYFRSRKCGQQKLLLLLQIYGCMIFTHLTFFKHLLIA